ncbi:MAG: helix-turn-helix domain-containing protein [Bauldia sp.]|uniref:helix-turn-helix domain-containing protein n=1 Tax=Bauldia sp. TaxID=2575872 RepID=UPI001E09D266|nr:AraC family transcriptional regulator [Bauldia sp.]MCB1496938.1 helix-turn-helix domain-containing protein [Bauldia sp.]
MSNQALFSRISGFGPIVALLREREGNRAVETLQSQFGLSLETLPPQHLVSFNTMADAFERASRLIGDPLFGYHLGTKMDASTYGPMGEFALGADKLVNSFRRLTSTMALQSNSVRLIVNNGGTFVDAILRYGSPIDGGVWHHAMHVGIPLIKLIQSYAGEVSPIEIGIAGADAFVRRNLEDAFGIPVVRDAEAFRIRFPTSWLFASKDIDRNPWRMMTRGDVVRHLHPTLPQTVTEAIEQVVRLRLNDQTFNLDDIALALGASRRTVQERLNAEGSSFRDMLLRLRMSRAQELLTQTDMSVAEIAQVVGYSEQASFHRAFAKHVGRPPGAWRSHGHRELAPSA